MNNGNVLRRAKFFSSLELQIIRVFGVMDNKQPNTTGHRIWYVGFNIVFKTWFLDEAHKKLLNAKWHASGRLLIYFPRLGKRLGLTTSRLIKAYM